MKKRVPFVHSGYKRLPDDFYKTIDIRCVYSLASTIPISRLVDVCAPSGSGIVEGFKSLGVDALGVADAFIPISNRAGRELWIVTNPPYVRPAVDRIITKQILRVERDEVWGFACLLRSNFDFAKSRVWMFDHPNYYGEIKMRFRPFWIEGKQTASPIHNYVWHIWQRRISSPTPVKLYADGSKP